MRKAVMTGGILLTSCALHAGGFAWHYREPMVQLAGGASTDISRLGSGFVDMTSGTVTPVETTEHNPVLPAPTQTPAEPVVPAPPLLATIPETDPVIPQSATLSPSPISAASPDVVTTPIAPAETIPPVVAKVSQAQADTPRPSPRPVVPAATRPEPRQPPSVQAPASEQPETEQPVRRQGGDQNSRRGEADGQENAVATETSSRAAGNATTSGNAAASNYDGKVWRRLSRTRRVRAGGRGTAVVTFHIETSGAASRIRVQRSSGNPAIDQAAIAHVQRTAPFPAPPAGARRDFGYTYEGRR